MKFTLIEGGDLYTPKHAGVQPLLVADGKIARLPLETVLACYTSNPATVLKLGAKGALAPDKDADVLVLKRDTLEIVHVFARGR
jgi:beta-aspartyl-dipeptidase (metallo-type)